MLQTQVTNEKGVGQCLAVLVKYKATAKEGTWKEDKYSTEKNVYQEMLVYCIWG